MSLRRNALLLILLTALIAIVSDWNSDFGLSGWWRLPAALLLLGLAYESLVLARIGLVCELLSPGELYLGRAAELEFKFSHALRRATTLEFILAAPDYIDLDPQAACLTIAAARSALIRARS